MAKYDNFSREELIELLQKRDKELSLKKYGLVWDSEKEPEKVVVDCAKKLPILKSVPEKDIKTNDDDYNIMIEGDNYHALQVLNYTHKEKIDVIYIDPPYNTGNKDFVYNDKFVDKEDGYRHSKWLNFMEKRLELAKELLKDDGVIFISIDDNEFTNLTLLCQKIFGEENVENIIWHKVDDDSGRMKVTYRIRREHEYILICYKQKNNVFFKKFKSQRNYKNEYSNPDNDPRGAYKQGIISTTEAKSRVGGKNYYTVITPSGRAINRQWRITQSEFETLRQDNRIYFGKAGDSIPSLKVFINEDKETTPISIFKDLGTAKTAGRELFEMFGKKVFNYPKPVDLVKRLFEISTRTEALVLDFFAGSGTTAHALLELNEEDKGKRHFILCTNNEGNIATGVCYLRVQKIINGYKKNGDGEFIDGLGGNLKYFRTDFVENSKNTTQIKINLARECSDMISLKTGRFNQISIKNSSFKIFSNNKNDQYTCIYFDCFDTNIQSFIKEISKLNGKKDVYIFSLTDTTDNSLFKGISDVKLEAIPYKILDLYRRIAKAHIKGSNHD